MAFGSQSIYEEVKVMRILFVSSSSGSRGGGELYLVFLAEALVAEGTAVALWCSTHSRMDELANSFQKWGPVFRSEYKNTYDYKLRSLAHWFVRKKVKGIERAFQVFQPDVIHLNKQNLEDGLDLIRTLDEYKTPYVTTIHITQTQKSLGAVLGGWRDAFSRTEFNRAKSRKWIAISQNRSVDLSSFLGSAAGNVMMIPNGVKVNEYQLPKKEAREVVHLPAEALIIISVGRLEAQKDPMAFLDWASRCVAEHPNVLFYWIGDGSLRADFESQIAPRKLTGRVHCLGWQTDLAPYYAAADIYVHTAKFEGLPFSLLEAMAQRLPCVVADGLHEDLGFPEGVLAKGLTQLVLYLQDENLRCAVGEKGYHYAVDHFSWNTVVQKYLGLYKALS